MPKLQPGIVNEVATDPLSDVTLPRIPARDVALGLISVVSVIWLLQVMQSVLIPFVVGGLLFYALDPAVDWLQARRLPRAIGAALMLLIAVSGCGVLTYTLQEQAFTVIDDLPQGARKLAALLEKPGPEPGPVAKVQQAADALQQAEIAPKRPGVMRVQVEEQGFRAGTFVWTGSIGLVSAVNQAVIVLFLTYFMLLSDQLFKRKLIQLVGTLSQKKLTMNVLEDIASQIQQFLAIQILTSGGVAIATGVALWMMGLEQAAFWGLLAGIFNSIPYYGPLLVTTGLATVGFLQFNTLGMTAAVAGVSLLITTLEGSILTPMLMGRASSMNHVAVFAGLLFWSWVWGVWGMLLAVPVMMVLKVLCEHVEALHPVAHFLRD